MDRSVVLVTGASRGIGQATAMLLAGQGYRVFGTARKPSGESAGGIEMLPLDVTCEESVQSCVAAVLQRAGRVDVLVNNAGFGLIGAAEEITVEEARALFDTNLFGAARMADAVLPGMRQRGNGLIINIGSLAPALPIPFHGYLSASKAALNTFSDSLRLEVKSLGIAVTAVEPGAVATHPGEWFADLLAAGSIGDYAQGKKQAIAVLEQGQNAGTSPQAVAGTILKIIRAKAPARYYPVGTATEKTFLRLTRFVPPRVIESLMIRHFQLPG